MDEIKTIPTKHNGVTFRSRTEARWAVFFDLMHVVWRYEPEGFQLKSGWYVPDFWLPGTSSRGEGLGTWVEIKGRTSTTQENELCQELAAATRCPVLIFTGQPADSLKRDWQGHWVANDDPKDSAWMFCPGGGGDGPYCFCICPKCGTFGFQWSGLGERICEAKQHCMEGSTYVTHPRVVEAADAASIRSFWK